MAGSPPPVEKRVTLENWQWQPFNHWAFKHMEQIMKVALMDRGNGPIAKLPAAPRTLAHLEFKAPEGGRVTVAEALQKTDCNGFILLKGGKVLFEYYANGLKPQMRHLLQSAGKSFVGTLAIALV